MTICSDHLSGERPQLGEQREGVELSLDGTWLDTYGTIAHALFGNQYKQTTEAVVAVGAPLMVPDDPKLQCMFEA